MIGALVYLRVASLGNWLDRRVRRLRQPKYFLGALAGAAYIWFVFLRPPHLTSVAARGGAGQIQSYNLTNAILALCMLGIVRVGLAWLAPDKPGLGFTEAEIAFLFPAPVTRRTLVHYKLFSAQATILLSTLIITIVARRWSSVGGNAFTHAVGWWLFMSVFSLHNTGAALAIARLNDRGFPVFLRQVIVSAIVAVGLGSLLYGVWHSQPASASLLDIIGAATSNATVSWVFAPFRVVLGPFLAPDWTAFALALGPALAVLAAHYLWVYKSEASFEEASIAQAEKRARRIAAVQAGRFPRSKEPTTARRPPFRLNPAGGRIEVAFLWKNLLSTRSFFNYRNFLGAAAIIVVVCLKMSNAAGRGPLQAISAVALVMGGYTLVLGPQFARQDMRSDLVNADLLKSYPVPGWRIVLGQLLAPTAILTGIVWLCLIPELFSLTAGRAAVLPIALVAAAAASVAILTPLVCFVQLMIPNAAVLFFPSWAGINRRDRGIDAMGQRFLFAASQFLVMLLALVPVFFFGALFGAGIHFLFTRILGFDSNAVTPLAVGIGATVGVALLAAEIAAGIAWIGRQFEKFDPSAETTS